MNFPVFRFELEGMRHTLLTHLGKYHEELEQMVDDKAKYVIEHFEFEPVIKAGLEQALKDEIEAVFKYGAGRRLVQKAVKEALGLLEEDNDRKIL